MNDVRVDQRVPSPAAAPKVQAPARPKGPRVWLDMDQQELDDAYDQSKYAPNLQQVVKRYATNSEEGEVCVRRASVKATGISMASAPMFLTKPDSSVTAPASTATCSVVVVR